MPLPYLHAGLNGWPLPFRFSTNIFRLQIFEFQDMCYISDPLRPPCVTNTGWASLIRNAWDRKGLGFRNFSDFEIFAHYNEITWGWEPNLNAKPIYVSYTPYKYIGFIYGIKTN
jgi:hypothetical protein